MDSILAKVKESLAIVSTATGRDNELRTLILAAEKDMERQGIKVLVNNELYIATIIMFVKANFGLMDDKQKEYAQKTYILLCQNLGLSSEFKGEDND